MISRTSRDRRLRDHAWAFLAVLLVATETLGDEPVPPVSAPVSESAQAAEPGTDIPMPVRRAGAGIPLPSRAAIRAFREQRRANSAAEPAATSQPQPSEPVTSPVESVAPAPVESMAPVESIAPAPVESPAAPVPSPSETPAPVSAPAPASVPIPVPVPVPAAASAFAPAKGATNDAGVKQVACSTCGGGHPAAYHDGSGASQTFCGPGGCHAGQEPCFVGPEPCTFAGRFAQNLYECLCCPDPCYQPKWIPAANASFFTDYARPRTVTRIRFDRGLNFQLPDRNEYFYKVRGMNKAFTTGSRPFVVNGVQYRSDPSLNYSQLYFYQEVAAGKGSFFFELPYRQFKPLFSPSAAGFSDIRLGTKSLLFDCELLQVTLQFKTYLPSGNAMGGLGTGHVSLEPSLLFALRLGPDTFMQAQLAQWIPLGGTPGIAGGLLSYNMSFNHVLYWCTPNTPLIGTFELYGGTFQNGGATNPVVTPLGLSRIGTGGDTFYNLGPGLRMSVCDRLDYGGAIVWPVTDTHLSDPLVRLEMRFLY